MSEEDLKKIMGSIETIVRQVYNKGCDDALHSMSGRASYEKGLDDAWECARKIVSANGLKFEQLDEIFGKGSFLHILDDYTASEAIDKIREYEAREEEKADEEEIKVGDEVKVKGNNSYTYVVTGIKPDNNKLMYMCLKPDGDPAPVYYNKPDLIKTGRSFPQIAEVLKQLKGE